MVFVCVARRYDVDRFIFMAYIVVVEAYQYGTVEHKRAHRFIPVWT